MQCAQAWASVLASLPGSWLLAVDTMPAFMQSSKLHLSLFQTEVAWRSGLEHAATQHLFMREAANFFSPLEYRLFTTVLNSNGSKTVFSPIVVGRTYQAPGSILREEEGEPGQDDQLARGAGAGQLETRSLDGCLVATLPAAPRGRVLHAPALAVVDLGEVSGHSAQGMRLTGHCAPRLHQGPAGHLVQAPLSSACWSLRL